MRGTGIGIVSAIALCAAAVPHGSARAQPAAASAEQAVAFAVPASSLSSALVAFGRQAGLQVSFSPELAAGKTSAGASGTMSRRAALANLLAGTGLSYRFANARTVTISGPSAASSANAQSSGVDLPAVDVRSNAPKTAETAYGPVSGYVATRSATGTKSDTPLIETPQSISVVTRDQIDAQQADSMKQALRYTAGVSSENRANFYSADIMYSRGFILNRYLDGLRLQGDAATAMAPQVELYGIERIEVLRGPASVLYGQSSPGGIVNLVSKRPTATPFAEVVLQGGSFNRRQAGFDFGGAADKEGKYSFRLTGLFNDADNQVDFVKEQRIFIAPAFTWRPTNDTTLTVLANYQRDPYAGLYNFVPYRGTVERNPLGQVPTNFYAGDPNYNKLSRDQASISSLFEHRFDDVLTVRQNMRYQHMKGDLNQVIPLFMPDNRTLNRYAQTSSDDISSFAIDNQAQLKFATGPLQHTALFGVDYQRTRMNDRLAQEFTSDIDIYNPIYYQPIVGPSPDDPNVSLTDRIQQTQRQIGFYAQDQIKIGKLALLFSGRGDHVNTQTYDRSYAFGTPSTTNANQNDNAFTKRVGAVYLFENGLAPYVAYATSFNPVMGGDRSGQPFKPTKGELYETGIKFQPTGFNGFVQASVFQLTQQNAVTVLTSDPTYRAQIGEIRSRGYEIEAKASVSDRLDLTVAYAYSDPVVTQSLVDSELGKIPVNVPKQTASAWADYTIRDGALNGLGFAAGIRYIGPTFADPDNAIVVPSYTVTDAAIHYDFAALRPELKGFKLSLNATNLFDKVYVSQCTYSTFAGPNTNCVYGLRRTVLATLRYKW